MKNYRTEKAVSEIMGTVLLLAISVSLFSVVYIFVLNESLNPTAHPPAVHIIGTTQEKEVILENRGQEPLSADSTVMLVIAGNQLNVVVRDYLSDTNGDDYWNVGERLVFNSSNLGIDIIGLEVRASIIDAESGALVLTGIIQDGEVFQFPYVLTSSATNVESDRATLWMKYNFRNNTGDLRFAYKKATGDWNYTTWLVDQSGEGSYGKMVTGLTPETIYLFKAQLKYNNETIEDVTNYFTTPGVIVGMWHFDTGSGTIAVDSSGRDNHGNLFYGPQWTIGINGTALNYDGIDDYVEVPDNPSLDLSDEITIETWINPLDHSEGYYGEITTTLDTSQFGILNCYEPDIINIVNNIYAIVCRGTNNDGFLTTMEIFNDGNINPTIIDILEFDTSNCYNPKIIHVTGDIYAVAYEGPNWHGLLKTVEITSYGKITDSVIDTLEFNTNYAFEPCIIHVNGDIYAISYTGPPDDDGLLTTVKIASDGMITNIVIDTSVYDDTEAGVSADETNMIHVSGIVYAIVYRNPDDDGELRTVGIANDGMITSPGHIDGNFIDKFTFDAFDGWKPNIHHVSGDSYAVFYGGRDNQASVKIVEIYSDGTIKNEVVDRFYFDNVSGREPSAIQVNGPIYAVAYRGTGNDGFLVTFQIESAMVVSINPTIIDILEFDTSNCYNPKIIHVNGSFYAIAYRGNNNDGILKTVEISDIGMITDPVIDSAEVGIFDFDTPDAIHIFGDVYAIAYRGLYSDGYIRTFKIDNTGFINDSTIDTIEFDTDECWDPKIIHVNGDIYAVAYEGPNWHGLLKTVEINSYGNITDSVIDTLEFDSNQGWYPSIIHVSGDIYAIAYTGTGNDGWLTTVSIDNTGAITDTVIDSLDFNTNVAYEHAIIHINGDVFAIAYRGPDDDGWMTTVEIDNMGAITNSVIDNLEFDADRGYDPDIIPMFGDIYAIVCSHTNLGGYLTTVEILSNGTITDSILDTIRFDNIPWGDDDCYDPDIIHIYDRVIAIVYRGEYDGYLKTLRIGENGDISNQNDDTFQFDGDGYKPDIFHINGDVYAIAYRRGNFDGYVETVEIEYKYTSKGRGVVAKDGAYRINANTTTVFAYINNNELTAPISLGFNYIVLTYDKNAGGSDQMKLYVNTTLVNWTSYSTSINTNNNNLYIGWLNSIIDEVTLWRTVLTQSEINHRFNDHTGV
ncbi:MAG: type IV pilin [Thermoplasmatales archaeon]|nr:MAG: type IV pilin [Thermoplasmatales archaeon]